jgi:hypothetical protein
MLEMGEETGSSRRMSMVGDKRYDRKGSEKVRRENTSKGKLFPNQARSVAC